MFVLIKLSCKIFEHFALQTDPVTKFIKLGSGRFKEGANLAPKLANLLSIWISSFTPSKKLDPVTWSGSTHILYYIKTLIKWNKALRNQISLCQQVFYYKAFQPSLMFQGRVRSRKVEFYLMEIIIGHHVDRRFQTSRESWRLLWSEFH